MTSGGKGERPPAVALLIGWGVVYSTGESDDTAGWRRPDCSKWLCPQTLYNPYKRYAVKIPLDTFQKLAKNFQGKAVQSKTLRPNLSKIDEINFLP